MMLEHVPNTTTSIAMLCPPDDEKKQQNNTDYSSVSCVTPAAFKLSSLIVLYCRLPPYVPVYFLKRRGFV